MFDVLLWLIGWIIWIICSIIVLILAILWYMQGSLLYFPDHPFRNFIQLVGKRSALQFNPEGFQSLEEYGIEFEHVYFSSVDGTILHGWFVPCKDAQNAPTIIFFHGNAGSKNY
jgi:hypothetical protein